MWFHSIHWLGWSLRNIFDFTIYIDLDDRYGIYVMWCHSIHWPGWSLRNICDFTVYIDLDDRYGIYVISQYTLTWTIVTEYMCHKWQRISSVCRYYNLVLSSFSSWLITGFVYVARVIQWVSLEEQKQSILPEHPRSSPGFSWGSCCSMIWSMCSVL